MCDSKWFFTEDQLANARKSEINGIKISNEMELFWRQEGAELIQNMGVRLRVSQLCINTAIVYFHRFYVFHPFSMFPHYDIAATAFFLASKVEEHPRKIIDVIKVLGILTEPLTGRKLTEKEVKDKVEELILLENFLVQTLGAEFNVDHPHVYVVYAIQNFRSLPGFNEMGQIFYFMATTTLHLTTMCLKYPSTYIAASCIDITCRWLNYEFPGEVDGMPWFKRIDNTLTDDLLTKLRREFFNILEKSPLKTQNKIEVVMKNRTVEVPKPPVSHRASMLSSNALQEKKDNRQRDILSASKTIKSKSLLDKRQGTENRHHKKPSSALSQSFSYPNQQNFNYFPNRPSSSQFSETQRDACVKNIQSSECLPSMKRKFDSLSDGDYSEESDRDSKMRKVGDFTDFSKLTENSNFKDFSPPKTETASSSNEDLMNVVNVHLTFMPSEQMYIPPTSNSFPNNLYDFKQDFICSNSEKINAGC